jgi:hypothetical protein
MRWLIALGIVVGGVIVGSVLSGQVRRIVGRPNRAERTRSLAQPIGSLAFSVVLAAALIGALGVADKTSLEKIPNGLLAFVPKALVCTLMILLGQAAATMVASAVGGSMLRATGKPQHQLVRIIKALILGAFSILAISQLGVNTRIVDTLVSGLVFGAALSIALLTGLGGRQMANELAAGRYLKRIVRAGDRIAGAGLPSGTIEALHGATVELRVAGDETSTDVTFVHVPNHRLLENELLVTRTPAPPKA